MPTYPTTTALQRWQAACPVPALPRRLGAGGVIPFVALPFLAWVDPANRPLYLSAQAAYGAVILSFVGALHWALAMTADTAAPALRRGLYLWSVVPALLGWVALLLPLAGSLSLLLAGLGLQWLRDSRVVARLALPPWYLTLRTTLTLGAGSGLAAGLWLA